MGGSFAVCLLGVLESVVGLPDVGGAAGLTLPGCDSNGNLGLAGTRTESRISLTISAGLWVYACTTDPDPARVG